MNNDLISREAAKKMYEEKAERFESYDWIESDDERQIMLTVIKECALNLDTLPAVDAEPVRHGRWENAKAAFHKKCSHCKCILHMPRERNFCPNCGAKMDGGDGK